MSPQLEAISSGVLRGREVDMGDRHRLGLLLRELWAADVPMRIMPHARDPAQPSNVMMYDMYIMKRTQIYLSEEQAERLSRRAALRGTTASKMIREAVDQYLAEPGDEAERQARYRTALDAAFGAAPYLATGAAYVDELRHADVAREQQLTERAGR